MNDKSTEGLNTTEIADLLKGPRGTQVKIVVSREGTPDYLTFTVIRDEISRKSVQDAFWIKPGIAYMKILGFGETTAARWKRTCGAWARTTSKAWCWICAGIPAGC